MRKSQLTDENTVQSIDLAVDVLTEISRNPDMSLTEIARNLGATKPRILRVLRTLKQKSFVSSGEDKRYRLGHAILLLGTAAWGQVDLVRIAGRHLEQLGQKVNETVQLRIRDADQALCVAKFEPSRDLRVHALVGRRRPLYAGSSKVLLAYAARPLQESIVPDPLPRFTENTITNRAVLFERLDAVRRDGYCISRGEVGDQLISVAVPVLDKDQTILAALNVVAPAFRTTHEDTVRFRDLLMKAAASVAESLRGVRPSGGATGLGTALSGCFCRLS